MKKLIEKAGQKAVLLPGDLNRREVCAEIVEKAVDGLGGLDVLVLAAGRQTACPTLPNCPTRNCWKHFRSTSFRCFGRLRPHCPICRPVRALLPLRRYRLISRASTCLIMRRPKAQSSVLRVRWPSSLPTAAFGRIRWRRGRFGRLYRFAADSCPENIPEFGQETPLRRAGQPAELASLYVYLASNESSYVTAEVMGVTGGMHLS